MGRIQGTNIGGSYTGKVHPAKRKGRWFRHISACYCKGYQAALDGKREEDCPYNASAYTKGLQQQRINAWKRGFNRAKEGKPLDDTNG
jgi:ribosome modulation factor